MKSLLTMVLLVFLSIQSQADSPKNGKAEPMTFYKMVKMFSQKQADQLHPLIKNDELTHFHAKGNRISFRWRGVYNRFEFIGKKNVFFLLNGYSFSFKDLQSPESIRLVFKNKLTMSPRQENAENQEGDKGRSQASLDAVSVDPFDSDFVDRPENPSNYQRESRNEGAANEVQFEHLLENQVAVYENFPDSVTVRNTALGVAGMNSAFDLMSGDIQTATLGGYEKWFGGMLGAAGVTRMPGESAMDAWMGYNRHDPNNIAKPWEN